MKVIRMDEKDATDAFGKHGIAETWLEIDEDGIVRREIGFTEDGIVRHKHPGDGPYGRYGIYDLTGFEPSTPAELPAEEFERMWQLPRIASEVELEEKPSIFRRILARLGVG